MKLLFSFLLMFYLGETYAQNAISDLSYLQKRVLKPKDWLLDNQDHHAGVYKSLDGKNIVLSNGLLQRTFRLKPNLACTDFTNLASGEQLIRAVSPEAKITIDGRQYNIGGLYGQKERGYLRNPTLDILVANPEDFQFKSFAVSDSLPNLPWKPLKGRSTTSNHPAEGTLLSFNFESASPKLKDIMITVNYQLYDGIPLLKKWITVKNKSLKKLVINKLINELLATPEEQSGVAGDITQFKKPHGLYVESNYAFNNAMFAQLSDQTSNWGRDNLYTSQVSYLLNSPCLLTVNPPIGPASTLQPGQTYHSIQTHELLLDGYDRERNGLAQRKMYRKVAPWSNQNPIFMHLVTIDPVKVKEAVDQCVQTGYEAIILSFGSGIDMENLSDTNVTKIKSLVDYAHQRGILLGAYSLFSSRKINPEVDVIDPKTGKPDVHAQFGGAPCLGSQWGLDYLAKIKGFIIKTGLDLLEHDGPYPGDVCASTKHPGHKGLEDSQWAQMELQKSLYHWCAAQGVYVNAPDWYFLDGTNKIALGYREVNFSLPRENQILLNRQNIYDGTWEKTPSMSWGFVPLTEYHGGGAAATLEPLSQHLDAYEQLMMQFYGAGIQACYRGPRLYDTEVTKQLVTRVINWYKKYRSILNADIIHLRRPDGRDWDGILHVDPAGQQKGLAMLYNPTNQVINKVIQLPLYYTGLKSKVRIREKEGKSKTFKLARDYTVSYQASLPANSYTWIVID
jgi:hypothetical protein